MFSCQYSFLLVILRGVFLQTTEEKRLVIRMYTVLGATMLANPWVFTDGTLTLRKVTLRVSVAKT